MPPVSVAISRWRTARINLTRVVVGVLGCVILACNAAGQVGRFPDSNESTETALPPTTAETEQLSTQLESTITTQDPSASTADVDWSENIGAFSFSEEPIGSVAQKSFGMPPGSFGSAPTVWRPHRNPDDPARHIGWGEPLFGTSWRNHPHSVGFLFGNLIADDPRGAAAELQNDIFAGIYYGYDFDHYFGCEARFAGGSYEILDSPTRRSDEIFFADLSLLYYPWGDARWRPYYSAGIGLAMHNFQDNLGRDFNAGIVHFPLGIGLKHHLNPNCALRCDIRHNISFGGGLDWMDNVSLTAGVEYHFGGHRKSYFPWNPGVYFE